MKLEELKRLCDEATPGPWAEITESGIDHAFAQGPQHSIAYYCGDMTDAEWSTASKEIGRKARADAAFIAAARAALPKLIAVAEAADRLTDCAVEFPENTSGACDEWFSSLCDALAALEAP